MWPSLFLTYDTNLWPLTVSILFNKQERWQQKEQREQNPGVLTVREAVRYGGKHDVFSVSALDVNLSSATSPALVLLCLVRIKEKNCCLHPFQ